MNWIKNNLLFIVPLLLLSACGPDRHPFEGTAQLPCAPAVASIIARGVADFESQYPKARINISRRNTRQAIDSLISGKTDQIVIDRPLTQPESLAFKQAKKELLVFRLARSPMAFIVHPSNKIDDLDSIQIASILTGRFDNWNQVGQGHDRPIRMYLPLQGEGVWELLQVLFKTPSKIVAFVVPSDSIAIRVSEDPDALGAMTGVIPENVKPIGVMFDGKKQRPTLRAIHEGRYPWVIPIVYITTSEKMDVGTSFLNYISSNMGQRLLANNGVLPAMVPLKVVDSKPK